MRTTDENQKQARPMNRPAIAFAAVVIALASLALPFEHAEAHEQADDVTCRIKAKATKISGGTATGKTVVKWDGPDFPGDSRLISFNVVVHSGKHDKLGMTTLGPFATDFAEGGTYPLPWQVVYEGKADHVHVRHCHSQAV